MPPSTEGRLELEREGAVLVARIANPARANALDPPLLRDIAAAMSDPGDGVRAVLLAGAGERHFSAGLDLGDAGAAELPAVLREGERMLGVAASAIAACPAPVIGVLNGAAFGGALELAIACDWRIARRGARIGMPAARLGVVYAAEGLARFVAAMGPARARRLFLSGEAVDADEALSLGLVEQVADAEELWPAARTAAEGVAAGAPLAIDGIRALIGALGEPAPDGAVRDQARARRDRAFASPDFAEGLRAFRERRPPEFRGG